MSVFDRGQACAALLAGTLGFLAIPASAAVSVSIGENFTGTTYVQDSFSALPPDANGAIGPRHFVEFINGSFAVYNKTNGLQVKRISDTKFWANAGVLLASTDIVTDPRVIYDPVSQRWFASMIDADGSAPSGDPTLEANDFLLAVSATADPTGTWHGFLFQADPDTGYFADFPTLGVDSNAVYIGGDMYQGQVNPLGAGLVSVPKSDLVSSSPTVVNRTWLGVHDYSLHGDVLQPATCFDGTVSGAILSVTDIGLDSNPHSNLVFSVVLNGGTPTASLTAATIIPTAPWEVPDNVDFGQPLLTPTQSDGTSKLMANDARISAKVYGVGGVLYAVHNTLLNGRIAIRWYRVRAADKVLLEAGTLTDPSLDMFFPSIAANASGVVVIAYNACGPSTTLSCFASVGQTANGVTVFGAPLLLQSGETSYHGDDEVLYDPLVGLPEFSRWGDYSATSIDPNDPNTFWTIQMYPSDPANNDIYSTQIIQLITVPPAPTLNIARAGHSVSLSWAVQPSAYELQFATNMISPVAWANYTAQTPITNGAQVSVTVPATTGRQYFRLHKL